MFWRTAINSSDILNLLVNSPLFRGVPRTFLQSHLDNLGHRSLQAGDTLLAMGKSNDSIYVVLSGRLRIHLGSPKSEAVEMFGQGDCVGEMSTLLDDGQVSAYVIADTHCELLVIDRAIVWSLINDSQKTARNLLHPFGPKSCASKWPEGSPPLARSCPRTPPQGFGSI